MTETPVAIVTGGARGIGSATARALSAEGWRLLLVDRCADDPALRYPLATQADLDAVVAACGGADGRAAGRERDAARERDDERRVGRLHRHRALCIDDRRPDRRGRHRVDDLGDDPVVDDVDEN